MQRGDASQAKRKTRSELLVQIIVVGIKQNGYDTAYELRPVRMAVAGIATAKRTNMCVAIVVQAVRAVRAVMVALFALATSSITIACSFLPTTFLLFTALSMMKTRST